MPRPVSLEFGGVQVGAVPGSGRYARGAYSGHHRPAGKLSEAAVREASDSQLSLWFDALNDAIDFEMMDGIVMHNMDAVIAEQNRRRGA